MSGKSRKPSLTFNLKTCPDYTFRSKSFYLSGNFYKIRFLFLLIFFASAVQIFPQKIDDEIRITTELVNFEVSVTDKDGNPVKNLQPDDFKIYEDGVERKIDFFEPIRRQNANRPLSIVFALDTSGSMTAEEILQLKKALQNFIRRFDDYNSYFAVMTFGMRVKTVQSFTNRAAKLEKTFEKILRDQDGLSTHAYDAVDDAVRMLRKKSPRSVGNQIPRKVVILITDGFPVGDTVSPKTVIERANDAETSVYAVLLPSFSRLQNNKKPLLTPLEVSGLIDRTGGKSFYATESNFEPLFKDLAEELTSSYAIAFYPSEKSAADGKFHEVKIETVENFSVKQNRSGYRIQ